MESTITATELAKNLSDVLNRIRYRGERFIVERNGEAIATLEPVGPRPGITWREFLARMKDVPFPDEDFAKDVAAVQAAQPPAVAPEWPN